MGGLDGSGGAGRLRPGGSNSGVDGPLRGAVCRQQHIASGYATASLGKSTSWPKVPCTVQSAGTHTHCLARHCVQGGLQALTVTLPGVAISNSEGTLQEQSACLRSSTCPMSKRGQGAMAQTAQSAGKLAVTWNGPDRYSLHPAQLSGRLHRVQCRLARAAQRHS